MSDGGDPPPSYAEAMGVVPVRDLSVTSTLHSPGIPTAVMRRVDMVPMKTTTHRSHGDTMVDFLCSPTTWVMLCFAILIRLAAGEGTTSSKMVLLCTRLMFWPQSALNTCALYP